MGWKLRFDWINLEVTAATDPLATDVETINCDGAWRVTLFPMGVGKLSFILEGIYSGAFGTQVTAVGTRTPQAFPIGGAVVDGKPVPLKGIMKVRFLSASNILILREWIDEE